MWTVVGLLIAIPLLSVGMFYLWATSGTAPTSQYEEIRSYGAANLAGEPGQEAVTIVTYNIGYLSGLTNNLAVARSPSLFEDNLKQAIAGLSPLQPDILALQEIDLNARRSFYVNQADALAQALDMTHGAIAINWDKRYVPFPYWPPSAHFGQIVSGQAVLSRFLIQENQRIVLQKVESKPFFYNALYLDRLAQVTQVDVQGRPLMVINLHLEAFDELTRRRQTERVKTLVESYLGQYPVIVLGDFNSAPPDGTTPNPTIRLMLEMPGLEPAFPRGQLNDAAIATFPSNTPVTTLDYIFYTPDSIEAVDWQVIEAVQQASDHRPVMFKFRFR